MKEWDASTWPEHIQRDAARYGAWMALCERGQCVYKGLDPSWKGPTQEAHLEAERCPGYRGVVRIEHGQPVLRVSICFEQQRWWKARQAHLRATMAQKRSQDRYKPSTDET